ncbi:hypothetical protein SAMN05660293_02052 [Dyadobacter psychrophilus]|uniref:CarboxypepD_reg-like domain-containing protein n=2 Tax=Dyadobacter psychrophilus TaxID=651661 RepID=A0A1T5DZW5_9BACT|nr:hypothetical protein SAMN05660293_02052 [Dyadobacter psychrophilus]
MTVFSQSRVTISGFVKELTSHELLSGVDVYVAGTANNVVTNAYGFYSLTVFTNLTIALTWRCGFTKN